MVDLMRHVNELLLLRMVVAFFVITDIIEGIMRAFYGFYRMIW